MSIKAVIATQFDATGLKKAQKAVGALGGTFRSALGAAGIGLSIAAITNGLREATKAAIEDGKSQALLATQLRNTVGASDAQIASVEQSIKQMMLQASVADDVIRPAFAQLVRATGDVGKATTLTSLALDVSAGTGRDVNSVAIALSKAYQGNTTALSRLGIKAKDGVDIFAQLTSEFAGTAEAAANNDPLQRLSIIFGEMQETVGTALLPTLQDLATYFASAEGQQNINTTANNIKDLTIGLIDFGKIVSDIVDNSGLGYLFAVLSGDFAKAEKLLMGVGIGTAKRYANQQKELYAAMQNTSTATKNFTVVTAGSTGTTKGATSATKALTEAQKASKKAQEENSKARIKYWQDLKAAAEAVKAEQDALAEAQKTIASAAKDLTSVMSTTELGEFESRVVSTFDNIRQSIESAIESGAITKAAGINLTNYADTTSKALAAIAKQRDALVAKRSLVEALFGDVKGSLMGAGSLSGLLEQTSKTVTKTVTSIVNGLQVAVTSTTEEITSGGLLKNFKAVLDKTKKFADQLKQLRKLGLDKNLFAEIVGAGAEAGGALANEIIAGGADAVAELNTAYKDLADVSGQIAEQTAVVMYNDGKDVAGGIVAGLMSQEQALISAAEALANAFISTFNQMMSNITIPSLAGMTGLNANGFAYNNAPAGTSGDDSQFGSGTPWAMAVARNAATQINVNVNAGLVSSPEEVGSQINTALLAYKRSNGEI